MNYSWKGFENTPAEKKEKNLVYDEAGGIVNTNSLGHKIVCFIFWPFWLLFLLFEKLEEEE